MKKILSLLMAVCIAASFSVGVGADDSAGERIEIKLKRNENVFQVNGNTVISQAPEIIDGTTFVPVSVITEAFGALLEWKGFAKEITLTYNESRLKMTVGSREAFVDGEKVSLPNSPVIVNGTVMVPLRFIAELYEADVEYNPSLAQTVVTKLGSSPEEHGANQIDGLKMTFTKPRFGDSYYEWSLKAPASMTVDNKSFDGSRISMSNNEVSFYLYVDEIEDDEMDLNTVLEGLKGSTWGNLVKSALAADSEGNEYALLQSRTSYSFDDTRVYIKGDKIYRLETNMIGDLKPEERAENLKLAGTFSPYFGDPATTQDISEITGGFVPYVNKEYKISFDLPRKWASDSYGYGGGSNSMSFSHGSSDSYDFDFFDYMPYAYGSDNYADFYINIYSRNPSIPLEEWAKLDYERNVAFYNPKMVKATEIAPRSIGSLNGVAYTVELTLSSGDIYRIEDMYAYLGSYGYNFTTSYITYKEKKEKYAPEQEKQDINKMIGSLKAETLDFNKVGELQMNEAVDYTLSKKVSLLDKEATMYVPKSFSSNPYGYGEYDNIMDNETGLDISIDKHEKAGGLAKLKEQCKEEIEMFESYDSHQIKSEIRDVTIGGLSGYKYEILSDRNEYMKKWCLSKGTDAYIITLNVDEVYVGGSMDKAAEDAIKTFKLE